MGQSIRKHLVNNAPMDKHKDFIIFVFVHGVGQESGEELKILDFKRLITGAILGS